MRYLVSKTIEYTTTIEAASAEEALAIAEDSNIIDLDCDSDNESDWEIK